jgi:hypothetical protein
LFHSPYRPQTPGPKQSSCLSLLNVGITDKDCHTQLKFYVNTKYCYILKLAFFCYIFCLSFISFDTFSSNSCIFTC